MHAVAMKCLRASPFQASLYYFQSHLSSDESWSGYMRACKPGRTYPPLIWVCTIIWQSVSVLHILGACPHVDSQLVLWTPLLQAHDTVKIGLKCLHQARQRLLLFTSLAPSLSMSLLTTSFPETSIVQKQMCFLCQCSNSGSVVLCMHLCHCRATSNITAAIAHTFPSSQCLLPCTLVQHAYKHCIYLHDYA